MQKQIAAIAAIRILRTNLIAIPGAASVQKMPAFHTHSLRASVSAVQPGTEINRIGVIRGGLLRNIHRFGSNAASSILFRHAQIYSVRTSPTCKRPVSGGWMQIDISGYRALILRSQRKVLFLRLAPEPHFMFFSRLIPSS